MVTDADNTLWDTDAVFATAQTRLLRSVEEATNAEGQERTLDFLREIDQQIALAHDKNLRYPPELLVASLAAVLTGVPTATAVERVILGWRPSNVHINQLVEQFVDLIRSSLPELRPGVEKGMIALQERGIRPVVLTEGDKERCLGLLSDHRIDSLIRAVVEDRKSPQVFQWIQEEFGVSASVSVMIGDQLDKDIEYAHAAGYITIYFPSRFTPAWTKTHAVVSDHQVSTFDEVVTVINGI